MSLFVLHWNEYDRGGPGFLPEWIQEENRLKASNPCRSALFGIVSTIFLILISFSAPSDLHAQDRLSPEQRFERRLQEASRNLRRGNAQQARRVFEELLEQKPLHRLAFIGYVQARIEMFDIDGLAGQVRERLAGDTTDKDYILLLGDVHAAGGNPDRAIVTWRTLLTVEEDQVDAYRSIADRMGKQRMITQAIEFLNEGREVLLNPVLFAKELADFYDLVGEGDRVAEESVNAVIQGTMREGELLRRVQNLKNEDVIDEYPYEQIQTVLDSIPTLRGLREVLAGFYLDDRECDLALEEYKELDTESNGCGNHLLPFARSAFGKGCNEAAAAGLQVILDRCDRPSIRIETQFLLGQVHRKRGDGGAAAKTYKELIGNTQNPGDRRRARYELATTLLDDMGEPEEAILHFRQLLTEKDAGQWGKDARFQLARAYMVAGRLADAAAEYEKIEQEAPDDGMRERAIYGKGQAHYFAGDFDAALEDYRLIIDSYAQGRYINDALEQSIFISEHRDAGDGPLQEFGAALLLIKRHEFPAARAKLNELLEILVISKLRDEFIWEITRIDEAEGRFGQAISGLERVLQEFPEERLAAASRMRIGDLYCERLHDLTTGIEQYETFLIDYPNSILSDEVRRKKREAEKQNEL